jgi:sarcosine oxidase subunit delta
LIAHLRKALTGASTPIGLWPWRLLVQIFPCPFCGPRDENEFHYVGEPKARPEPAGEVGDAAWADYLWFNANPKGQSREIWLHLTCMEMFVMTRDTALNATVAADTTARATP